MDESPARQRPQTRFKFIARKLPLLVEAYDKNSVCIFWNDAAVEVSGYTAAEIEGHPEAVALLYPDVDLREQMLREFQVRGYDFRQAEWVLTRKDGAKRTITWFNVSKFFQPVPEWANWAIGLDLTPRLVAETDLKRKNRELTQAAGRLTETNTALRVLLEARLEEKKRQQENFVLMLEKMLSPFVDKLRQSRLSEHQQALVEIISHNIQEISAPLSRPLSRLRHKLTPGEFEVAVLIGQGKASEEIADLLHLSPYTVAAHRRNIRRKIGLTHKKQSLAAYLQGTFTEER